MLFEKKLELKRNNTVESGIETLVNGEINKEKKVYSELRKKKVLLLNMSSMSKFIFYTLKKENTTPLPHRYIGRNLSPIKKKDLNQSELVEIDNFDNIILWRDDQNNS